MTRFRQLQDAIGCTNKWLTEMLGYSPEHISRLRSGAKDMDRRTELAMQAMADGWRPR